MVMLSDDFDNRLESDEPFGADVPVEGYVHVRLSYSGMDQLASDLRLRPTVTNVFFYL